MSIDWTKPVRTRDGREVVIYSREAGGRYPIHGRVEGVDNPFGWTERGSYNASSEVPDNFDLVNVPRRVKVERWVNVYDDGIELVYVSRSNADTEDCKGGRKRIACVHFEREVEEGEGLC